VALVMLSTRNLSDITRPTVACNGKSLYSGVQVSLDGDLGTDMVKQNDATAGHMVYTQINKIRKHNVDGSADKEATSSTGNTNATNGQKIVSYARVQHSSTADVPVTNHLYCICVSSTFQSFHSQSCNNPFKKQRLKLSSKTRRRDDMCCQCASAVN